jgi:alkanesulfonate monooxygenase SsuD/methylene tetrahydromethanopterin reductase-like flavin-dependent oxidoreductase (luciferase family)
MLIDLLLVPFGASYAEMRTAALSAEEAGFNGLWTFDHFREPVPGTGAATPECWTVLSALAEATSRLQLGPLVLNVANRKPGLLASMAATLQQVSNGRLLIGLGAGGGAGTPYTSEQEMLCQPVESDRVRAEKVAEAAAVLRLLWSGSNDGYEGRHYQVRNPSGFLRAEPPPPIIIGGFGRRIARIAGSYGDGLNAPAGLTNLATLIELARTERKSSGRDIDGFEVSVFAGFRSAWLNPTSPERGELERLGVRRLILQVQPPYPIDQIRPANVSGPPAAPAG